MQKVCVEIGHVQVILCAARQNVIDFLHPSHMRRLKYVGVLQAMPPVNIDNGLPDQRGQASPADDHAADQRPGFERAAAVVRWDAQLHTIEAPLAERVHEDEVRMKVTAVWRHESGAREVGPILEALEPHDGHSSEALFADQARGARPRGRQRRDTDEVGMRRWRSRRAEH